ncbi:C6 transcription factor [Penicillium sp. IBT 16267x]|nr:C6 transcription factor [Penicillium sp. IBT 16267x]
MQQIRGLSQRLREYESLLREVENIVPERISKRIHALLNQRDYDDNATKDSNFGVSSMHDADSVSSRSVGSLEAVDKIEDCDMADESSPTGDVKSSDMTWRQQRQEEADHRTKSQSGVPDSSKANQSHDQFDRHNMKCRREDFGIGVANRVQTC